VEDEEEEDEEEEDSFESSRCGKEKI